MPDVSKVLLIVILISIIAGCRNNNGVSKFDDFPETRHLEGSIIELEMEYAGSHVHIDDTLLFLTNCYNDEYQIHAYIKDSFSFIGKTARVGRGPGELAAPFYATLDTTEDCIWIPDMGNRIIRKYMIDSIINCTSPISHTEIRIPNDIILMYYSPFKQDIFSFRDWEHSNLISFFDNSQMIYDSMTIENNIMLYDSEDISSETQYRSTYYIYSFSPEKDKVAISYCYTDYLAVVDINGVVQHCSSGPDGIYQIPDINDHNQILTTQFMRSDSDYIYCLYAGTRRFEDESNMIPLFPQKIHVFNWKGEPVTELILEYDAKSFDIDYQNNRIITFSPECNSVVYYDFDANTF